MMIVTVVLTVFMNVSNSKTQQSEVRKNNYNLNLEVSHSFFDPVLTPLFNFVTLFARREQ